MSAFFQSLNFYYVGGGIILVFLGIIIFKLREPIAVVFEKVKAALGWVWFAILWAFPPMFIIIAYFTPSLSVPARWPIPESSLTAVLALLLLGGAWFIAQMLNAGSESARMKHLVSDFIVAALWTSLLLVASGFQAGQSQLMLWMALPTLLSLLDLVVNTIVGYRNAWQKNPTDIIKAG